MLKPNTTLSATPCFFVLLKVVCVGMIRWALGVFRVLAARCPLPCPLVCPRFWKIYNKALVILVFPIVYTHAHKSSGSYAIVLQLVASQLPPQDVVVVVVVVR